MESWRDRLERFGASGLGVAAFCEAEGVSMPRFFAWRKRLGGDVGPRRRGGGKRAHFIHLGALPVVHAELARLDLSSLRGEDLRIDLGHGVVLQIRQP